MKKSLPVLLLFAPLCVWSQIATRVDPSPIQTTAGNIPPGAYSPVLAVPGATITLCANSTCTITATSYTDTTAVTSCATGKPVVPIGTSSCTATADNQGNFGFWLIPGQYWYELTWNHNTYGPYPLTAPAVNAGVPVSTSAPMYLWAHFEDDDQANLRLSYSRDGGDWTQVARKGSYAPTSGQIRDPSVIQINGTFYFLATPATGCSVQFFSSTDLVNFSSESYINMANYASGCTAAWAPEWFYDPVSTNYYFWVSVSTATNPLTNAPNTFFPWIVQFSPSTGQVIGTPAQVTLTGTTQGRTFDFFPYYNAGAARPYTLVYADQQSGANVSQPVVYATAVSLFGAYAQQTTAGQESFGFGATGGYYQTEAPALLPLANGCVRITVDEWVFPSWGGRMYSPWYRDSCGSASTLFTPASLSAAAVPHTIAASEHGTMISLTNQAMGQIVLNAVASAGSDAYFNSRWGINVTNPLTPLEIGVRLASSGGIQYPEPAALSLNPDPASTGASPSNERAILTACGTAPQSCWLGWSGSGRFFEPNSSNGAFGMHQFLNTMSGGTGEASIAFGDSITQPGQVITSSQGTNHVWSMGENNQAIGANNARFFVYNQGLTNSIYVNIATVNVGSTGENVSLATGTFSSLIAGQVVIVNGVLCTIAASPAPTSSAFSCTSSVGANQTGVNLSAIRSGGVPFQISPVDGSIRSGYGTVFGGGAATAYGTGGIASLYSLQNQSGGVLNVGSGTVPATAVNTSGTTVTWVSGPTFAGFTAGEIVWINGGGYVVTGSVTSTSFSVTTSIGTLYGVPFSTQPTGQLRAAGLGTGPVPFASVPFTCGAATEGSFVTITDSTTATHGATIAGGSSNHVVGYCNGTNVVVLYP